MREGYATDAVSSAASYFDAKYDEESGKYASEISATRHIQKPYDFMEIVNGKDVYFRTDESILSAIDASALEKKIQLSYAPCLLMTTDQKIPEQYYNPGSQSTKASEDNFVMSILKGRSQLSASWHKNANDDIQLDFNTHFYNTPQRDNYFNKHDLFLNLVGAGSYGFLNAYDYDGSVVRYFIKNLSEDGIPKFMICVAETIDAYKLICDETGRTIITENELSSIITE